MTCEVCKLREQFNENYNEFKSLQYSTNLNDINTRNQLHDSNEWILEQLVKKDSCTCEKQNENIN